MTALVKFALGPNTQSRLAMVRVQSPRPCAQSGYLHMPIALLERSATGLLPLPARPGAPQFVQAEDQANDSHEHHGGNDLDPR